MPEDDVPPRFTAYNDHGVEVMARDEDGWCVAIDQGRMCCSIYDVRPAICRKFEMDGPSCQQVRADCADRNARGILLQLY